MPTATVSHGDFDRAGNVTLHNEPITLGDQMFIYYSADGVSMRHIGAATLPRDRFVGLASGALAKTDVNPGGEGYVLTKPLAASGKELEVNVEMLGGGALRVEVHNDDFSPIEGFATDDCVPVTADGCRVPIQWRNGHRWAELAGGRVMLVFRFTRSVLYAYRLA